MKKIIEYYENGNVQCEGTIKNNKQESLWTFYFDNGLKYREGIFHNGKPIGIWKEWYDTGQLKYESRDCYIESLSDDFIKIVNYWNMNGRQEVENGKGTIVYKDDFGMVKLISNWKNCVKEGEVKEFNEYGQFIRQFYYSNGQKSGKVITWHNNGKIAIEGNYECGEKIGEWKEYYESGSLKEVGFHKNEEYEPFNFWTEGGRQLLKEGSGKKIEIFGELELDIYIQYYEHGRFIKEEKISTEHLSLINRK